MKTLHYFAITVSLTFSSVHVHSQEEEYNCFESNYEVTPQGVFFWEMAWFTYYGIDPKTDRSANQMSFSGENVSELIDSQGTPPGVRLYYGLKSLSDTVPILVMVPIRSNCDDVISPDEEKQVLVSTGESDYFTSADSAAVFTGNWQAYNTINQKIETYINAYNYDVTVIKELLSPDENGNSGLIFEFGLRTISPQEEFFDTPDGNYGSIIYCNVVYGLSSDATSGEDRLDFAMPCPKLCDSGISPLSH